MKKLFFLGIILIASGFWATSKKVSIDFPLIWFGLIVLLDQIAQRLGVISLFSKPKAFLQLLLVSVPFWWFYEWINTYLKNWFYPGQASFDPTTWAVLATLSFSTVIPAVVVSSNVARGITNNVKKSGKQAKIPKGVAILISLLGVLSLFLVLSLPAYFFPLTWFIIFLFLDPANAVNGQDSIIAQVAKKNYGTIITLSIGAIIGGLFWESVNFITPKWTYPFTSAQWIWELPNPISMKVFQMPLLGYLGYIPFSWSAFAFVKYVGIEVPWLSDKL